MLENFAMRGREKASIEWIALGAVNELKCAWVRLMSFFTATRFAKHPGSER